LGGEAAPPILFKLSINHPDPAWTQNSHVQRPRRDKESVASIFGTHFGQLLQIKELAWHFQTSDQPRARRTHQWAYPKAYTR
jgi:hypothetical protein